METFSVVTRGWGLLATGSKVRDAAQRPPIHGTALHRQDCLAQMSMVPRLRNPNKSKGPGNQSVIKMVIIEKGAEKGVVKCIQ